MRKKILRQIVETDAALAAAYLVGHWAVSAAYLERGCRAVGGECGLILITYWATYKAIHCLLDAWEEKKHVEKR